MANVEGSKGGYDPFEINRQRKESITDGQALTHLIKAALGSGILSMPIAFLYSGLMMGTICFVITVLISGHASYVMAKCAHRIYYREQKTNLTYAEVAKEVFKGGPKCVQDSSPYLSHLIIWFLFLSYFGTCSVYSLIVANNMQMVLEYFTGNIYSIRLILTCLLVPCIMLVYIPNLKLLAPVSLIANIFIGLALLITTVYMVQDLAPISERAFFRFDKLPSHFSISIFAVICIGMIMPVVNSMREPPNFLGYCGVFVKGYIVIFLACLFIGFLGYWRYGEATEEAIPLNLPVEDVASQIVNLLVALAMYGTFGLQFTVCLEISWDTAQYLFSNDTCFCNYVVRTLLVLSQIGLAIAVPAIAPFMGLIGALCFSVLGIILPGIFEIILDLEAGFGPCAWLLWKNIIIIIFGIFALIFGTTSSLRDIKKLYD